jgi:putative two-component system response regulator
MDKLTILVVDDAPANIDVLKGILQDEYRIKVALNGQKAIDIANKDSDIDMILLDVMMPKMNGYQVCEALKSNAMTRNIPIIFVTAKSSAPDEKKGLALGAVDYIGKPVQPDIVKARVKTHMMLHNQQKHLEHLVEERTLKLKETQLEIIQCLGRAAEYKDNETGMHVLRMSEYSRILAAQLSNNKHWVNLLYLAAPMHDVGKIGISDDVLLKPGKLNPQEWELMKLHPVIGAEILGTDKSEVLSMAREVALSHHEKWDGSGYPKKLKGAEIPLSGRVVAVADVFDALTCKRSYKKAWTFEEACDYIMDNSGTHFDPDVCLAFSKVTVPFREIYVAFEE